MSRWAEFEIDCVNYLNRTYGEFAKFQLQGGADSTIADILVATINNKQFYMEAKDCPAQCGQFVLIPNIENNTFTYSPANTTTINDPVRAIMDHMNKHFDYYREAGTSGRKISLDSRLFVDWIEDYYKRKGVKLFISNSFRIVPIEDFGKHFSVTAKYRVKRSGSTEVGNTNRREVLGALKRFSLTETWDEGKKLFARGNAGMHDTRFVVGKYEYMISDRGEKYEIRKLSNTYNANVIFSIQEVATRGMSDIDFIHYLRSF